MRREWNYATSPGLGGGDGENINPPRLCQWPVATILGDITYGDEQFRQRRG